MSTLNFLHYFHPNPILFSFGPFTIFWYGFFMVSAMMLGIMLTLRLAKLYKIKEETIIDLSFWLIINAIIGARFYHIILQFSYYKSHLLEIPMIWKGGIAIHGAILFGFLTIVYFAKKNQLSFSKISALIVPSLALGQSIGRWGNYFNQELFGGPTNLPWGIPINSLYRPPQFANETYFHPAFLYESIGNFIIFLILIFLNYLILKYKKIKLESLTLIYLFLYSLLRFCTEFIRIDQSPTFFGLRAPQWVSIFIILFSIYYFVRNNSKNRLEKKEALC